MSIRCWGNPVLTVDLASGQITRESFDESLRASFLGGRGLGDWLLSRHVDAANSDPLGPENAIVFTSGLLLGTSYPGAVRNCVVFQNVLTKGYGESSSAGHFAWRLKSAGYDALVVCGRSPNPVHICIADGDVEIRDASQMSGLSSFETDRAIKRELHSEDASTCTIGPAGENLVRYACVNCDNRYLGRCGLGAVMGSKNLKAVAVIGTGTVEPADPERLSEIVAGVRELCAADPQIQRRAQRGSVAGGAAGYNEQGRLPVRNFQEVDFEGASRTGYEHVKPYCKEPIHCPTRCPMVCDRQIEIPKGDPYSGTAVSSMQATPAYNTTKLLIADMPTTIKAFEMCNAFGVDIHSWTCVMGWAIECFERGILTSEETDGLDLRWGDGPLALESIRRIALREGTFGDLLADGVAVASARLGRGSEAYAMQIQGMELDDDLRVDKAESLGILAETRGSGHTLATPGGVVSPTPEQAEEWFGTAAAADSRVYGGKPELVAEAERHRVILDCLGICFFSGSVLNHLEAFLFPGSNGENRMQAYAELIRAATGRRISVDDLTEVAERTLAVEKSLNALAGLCRDDEIPPERFFEPIPTGRSKGMALDREVVCEMLRRHSALHGWDPETGVPTRETLHRLGLEDVADRLANAGVLVESRRE